MSSTSFICLLMCKELSGGTVPPDSPKSGQGKLEGKIFDHSKKFYCGNVRRGAVLTRYLSFDHKSDNPTKSYFPTMGISFLESGIVGP